MKPQPLVLPILLLAALSVDPERIGFGTTGGSNLLRWGWMSALMFLPLLAVVARPQSLAISTSPVRFLLGSAAVGALVAPLSGLPVADTLLALGFVSLGLLGVLWTVEHGFEQLCSAYGISTFIVCVIGFWPTFAAADGRFLGIYGAANLAGIHGSILVVDGVRRWLRSPRGLNHVVGGSVIPAAWIVLGIAVLVLSDSRTSMAAALIGVLLLVRTALPRMLVIGGLLVALAALATTFSTDLAANVGREVSRTGELEEITTVTGRVGIWENSFDLIAERPLRAYGANGSDAEFTRLSEEAVIGFDPAHAHNFILQSALNGGVLGAVLLVVGLLAFFANRELRTDPTRSAIVGVILIHGITEAVVRVPSDLWPILAAALTVEVGRSIAVGRDRVGDQGARSASRRQTSPLKI